MQGSSGMQGHASPGNFLGSESFRQDIGQFHSPRITPCKWVDYYIFISRFQLGEVFHIKNIFIMKTLADFRKTVETGVDSLLKPVT